MLYSLVADSIVKQLMKEVLSYILGKNSLIKPEFPHKKSFDNILELPIFTTSIYMYIWLHFVSLQVVECLTQDFSSRKQPLFFYNLKPSVVNVFNGLQPKDFVVYHSEEELDNLIRGGYTVHCF
jgi:hypothetical protein